MEKIILELENIIKENLDKPDLYKRNLLKDYLQVFALRYIYAHKKYSELVFYGGSALAQCYDLPRLSEDLDFVDLNNKTKIETVASDLQKYFEKEVGLPVKIKIQKFRIYLKFPILKQLKLANNSQSDQLYLKVEIFKGFNFCKKYKTEIRPLFKLNQSILIKTFDLPTLMATKIRAILYRKWEKTAKSGEVLITVKGRDYFDLMWYLQKNISPNLNCLEDISSVKDLKKRLLKILDKVNERSIILDLENFIADKKFVKSLGKNIKEILRREINKL
ncbi:MAG: nucleotidyl transferase AbiEii/AbiGii toxin family protein [Candidatus Pacebacteria bacterium]|nr:nucleotidyl transferase AbiEii/AbiGii toxin family protein [Candidatus Paceibacterota bacterium]